MISQEIITIILIGFAAGVLSGLVGVGGGIILVPALIYFLQYTQHQAQGSSLAVLTLPVVAFAFFQYYIECKNRNTPINTTVILILAAGFVVGSVFGSKLALRIPEAPLKKIFALILFYTAFKMLQWDQWIVKWIRSIF
jgi:uncharacterized protein